MGWNVKDPFYTSSHLYVKGTERRRRIDVYKHVVHTFIILKVMLAFKTKRRPPDPLFPLWLSTTLWIGFAPP